MTERYYKDKEIARRRFGFACVFAVAMLLAVLALAGIVATIWMATASTWSDGLLSQRLAMSATGVGFLTPIFGAFSGLLFFVWSDR